VPIDDPEMARRLYQLVADRCMPTYAQIAWQVREAVRKCGLNPALNVHALRHTTATRLTQGEVHIRKVQRLLGHRNIQTTTKYSHVADADLAEAVKKLRPQRGQIAEHQENIKNVVDLETRRKRA
jgi:site-specific recombinase XerD